MSFVSFPLKKTCNFDMFVFIISMGQLNMSKKSPFSKKAKLT